MNELKLTVACWDYDRIRALQDGRVRADGLELNILPLVPEETFFRAFRNAEFEVSELSLSSTLMMLSRGECAYTPIPVFPSRSFRHSCIYVREGSGIKKPEDLKGRRVAISEYQVTAALVARGLLNDEYGVTPQDIQWIQAGLEESGREDKINWTPPAGVEIKKIHDRSIRELFETSEVDALISPRAPSAFDPSGKGPIQRMFLDAAVEDAYYRKTGIFPIMHVLGIRNDIHKAHPWVAGSLVKAFTKAKNLALDELADVTALKVALPFLPSHVTQAHQLFGRDFWAYGLEKNRVPLEAATRWSFEQGLSVRKMSVDELFAPQSLASFKV